MRESGVDRMAGRTPMLANAQMDVPLREADREITVEHRQTRSVRWNQLIDRTVDDGPKPDVRPPVLEYVGEKISKSESLRRCEENNEYIFTLNEQEDLDGNVEWNPARFINHSCVPNCDAE